MSCDQSQKDNKDSLSWFDFTHVSVSCKFSFQYQILNSTVRALSLIPEGPVVLAVGLHVSKVETETLGDVQHVAEVQTYGVEQHRGHADLIQGPHIVASA